MNKYYIPAQAELDLHMMTRDEARREVSAFLEGSKTEGLTKVRIITGKGTHSVNGVGVLNEYVRGMLERGGWEYFNAKYDEGGEGVLEVLL